MKNTNLRVMHSSEKDTWETPPEFFAAMEKLFGKFDLDVCATQETAKCDIYLDQEVNGLFVSWSERVHIISTLYRDKALMCWMNPPYGRNVTGKWIKKAIEESKKGATVVCLLPARTDTKWFRDCYENASSIYFVQGRLKFVGATDPAPFPSMIAVLGPKSLDEVGPVINLMSTKGEII